jgi:predicted transcriptional regulator of viral defense system
MNALSRDAAKVVAFSKSMGGVFTSADLKNLLNETDGLSLNRRLHRLQRAEALTRFSRGVFAAPGATLEAISARIREGSYVSLSSALSRHLMIGTLPAKTVFAVCAGRTQMLSSALGKIVYVGSLPELLFGYETTDGINYATPEKALLDMLYYYQKGRRYYFDIYSDVNISCVSETTIRSYLSRYRNSRFIAFVEGYLNDRLLR